MAITKEQIQQAAEELQAEDAAVTMNAVRERLKGGSYATISPVLREWKHARQKASAGVLEMPPEMSQAIQRAGAEIWNASNMLAAAEIKAAKAEAQAAVAEAQAERDEGLKEIERLEAQERRRQEELAAAGENAKRMEARAIKAEQSLAEAKAAAKATSEGFAARLEDAKEAMEKLIARTS